MKPILKVSNLTKIYGKGCSYCKNEDNILTESNICPYCKSIVACKNISFELFHDDILGIVGESGSGKSTLVKIVYFQEEPDSGKMTIIPDEKHEKLLKEMLNISLNEDINIFEISNYRKRLLRNYFMGMVYQIPSLGLKMHISAGGNIAEKLIMAHWRNIKQIRQRAKFLLEKTEVSVERMDDFVKNFSGGMQQRVQIAKALSNNPIILLLDEPTTGLDLSVQAKVLDLIKKLQKEYKVSTIVVSHDLGIIKHLTKRTMVMKNGYVVESGLTDQILEDPVHPYTQLLVNSTL